MATAETEHIYRHKTDFIIIIKKKRIPIAIGQHHFKPHKNQSNYCFNYASNKTLSYFIFTINIYKFGRNQMNEREIFFRWEKERKKESKGEETESIETKRNMYYVNLGYVGIKTINKQINFFLLSHSFIDIYIFNTKHHLNWYLIAFMLYSMCVFVCECVFACVFFSCQQHFYFWHMHDHIITHRTTGYVYAVFFVSFSVENVIHRSFQT